MDPTLVLRVATLADADAVEALAKASIAAIFPAFYDARQTASSIAHVGVVDRALLADGTYVVVEAPDGAVVGCGGWSRRDRLYAGSAPGPDESRLLDPATEAARIRAMFVDGAHARRGIGLAILETCAGAARAEGFARLALMATLPGIPLYERYGFAIRERVDVVLADGVTIGGAAMDMELR